MASSSGSGGQPPRRSAADQALIDELEADLEEQEAILDEPDEPTESGQGRHSFIVQHLKDMDVTKIKFRVRLPENTPAGRNMERAWRQFKVILFQDVDRWPMQIDGVPAFDVTRPLRHDLNEELVMMKPDAVRKCQASLDAKVDTLLSIVDFIADNGMIPRLRWSIEHNRYDIIALNPLTAMPPRVVNMLLPQIRR